eukprot:Nitzschia sp. Nitz4//scaffold18_size181773//74720//76483//NITZ4_001916-RA/size181773-processed-gene-0.15-mRNA-1//1//CDS//3329540014//6784//frame0
MAKSDMKRKNQADYGTPKKKKRELSQTSSSNPSLADSIRYIMAPMVGASELPFRLLCRKYGAEMCYTPMMMASEFSRSPEYRAKEFQTTPYDRPLCCHFAANDPEHFAKAAKLAEPYCDAIDLNLGCPQRTAYVGHFGSYLADAKDRELVLSIVRAGVAAVSLPIFVKIRLLDTYEETLELVSQLYQAGATLVAVHARYRATFHRKGPGARDGPAMLDQVQKLKATFPDKLMVANGNTITYDDVVANLKETSADGLMSAEGILDNPAIFLGRYGPRNETGDAKAPNPSIPVKGGAALAERTQQAKLMKKIQKIELIEQKLAEKGEASLTPKEKKKIAKRSKVYGKLAKVDDETCERVGKDAVTTCTLQDLYESSDDRPRLALEYLNLVRQYPATMRTAIFHTRRMLKTELTTFQLMQECLACKSLPELEGIVLKIQEYKENPSSFMFDQNKAKAEKEALERKRQEEGKRKAYEARMVRKAKREGLKDLEHYLRQGAEVPTVATVEALKKMSKQEQLDLWKKKNHGQHCLGFHTGGCTRGRACAFLHATPTDGNTFDESNEVAG